MAFLYVSYIVLYAVLGYVLGGVLDRERKKGDIHPALISVGGIMYTVVCVVLMASTFIPKGAFAINPDIIDDVEVLDDDEVDGELAAYTSDIKEVRTHQAEVKA
ncbi:hypothetical protein BGZ65_010393 [Modicella reniformis]|uniref:Uncharacterized protein n=1 Tax=Modicella reniformis TaxID=1440133 RepID=A0A9P6II02_9FUNG|nr:hypothetical protein BGZ65_010393 [Modicella reniformis]